MLAKFKQAVLHEGKIYSPRNDIVEVPESLQKSKHFQALVKAKLVELQAEADEKVEKPTRGRRSNED